MARPKNQPVKKNGRPPLKEMTDMQRELKNKVLKYTTPLFEDVLGRAAELAGVRAKKEVEVLKVKDENKPEIPVSASVQLSACKAILDLHYNTLKIVYGQDKDGTTTNIDDDDDEDEDGAKPKLASVHQISLEVTN